MKEDSAELRIPSLRAFKIISFQLQKAAAFYCVAHEDDRDAFGQVGFSCLESETRGGDIPAPLGRRIGSTFALSTFELMAKEKSH